MNSWHAHFWCDLKIWLMMFTRDEQLDNANLAKTSNWKLFLWSLFLIQPVWNEFVIFIQPLKSGITEFSLIWKTFQTRINLYWRKGNSYYPENKTKISQSLPWLAQQSESWKGKAAAYAGLGNTSKGRPYKKEIGQHLLLVINLWRK